MPRKRHKPSRDGPPSSDEWGGAASGDWDRSDEWGCAVLGEGGGSSDGGGAASDDGGGGSSDGDSEQWSVASPPRGGGFRSFEGLPKNVKLLVLSFCSMGTVTAFACASKRSNRLSKNDALWEAPLRHMLREWVDGSVHVWDEAPGMPRRLLHDPAIPLTERPDWRRSTALLRWWRGHRSTGGTAATVVVNSDPVPTSSVDRDGRVVAESVAFLLIYDRCPPTTELGHHPAVVRRFEFLTRDLPLREYYLRLGKLQYRRALGTVFDVSGDHHTWEQIRDGTVPVKRTHCTDCIVRSGWRPPAVFRNLPPIRWPFVPN